MKVKLKRFEEKVVWTIVYAAAEIVATWGTKYDDIAMRADEAVRQYRMRVDGLVRTKPPPTSVPDSPRGI